MFCALCFTLILYKELKSNYTRCSNTFVIDCVLFVLQRVYGTAKAAKCRRGRNQWTQTRRTAATTRTTTTRTWKKEIIQRTRHRLYLLDFSAPLFASISISGNRYPVRKQDRLAKHFLFAIKVAASSLL